MVGMERTILPAIAEQEFHLAARTAVLSFIVVFGVTKALTNYLAGRLSDRVGRKHVLVAGWLVAVPVPFLLMWAPTWTWVLVANVLLGVSQGLTWSTTVIMKIDLVGADAARPRDGAERVRRLPRGRRERRSRPGWIAARYGLRPEPFYLGVGFVARSGSPVGPARARDRQPRRPRGDAAYGAVRAGDVPTPREVFWRTTLTRSQPVERQPGRAREQPERRHGVGAVPARLRRGRDGPRADRTARGVYPATWGVVQLVTGALSDRIGRKWLIVTGMWVQALGIGVIAVASAFAGFAVGAVLLGVGTAMVYPTLLAAIGDVAHPSWRASAVGVYRLWRDLGYAVGALLAGVTADAFGLERGDVGRRGAHVRIGPRVGRAHDRDAAHTDAEARVTNTLFILNDPPYGTERSYNGLRFAGALSTREGEQVKVFLIGDAADCAKKDQKGARQSRGGRVPDQKTILILGGGVGGVVVASELRKRIQRHHRIVLIDRERTHLFAPSLLWLMVGRRSVTSITRPLRRLARKGIEVRIGNVELLDPQRRAVTVAGETLTGDYVIVSLGADLHPDAIPGLADAGHNFYTLAGAQAFRDALQPFRRGRIVVMTAAPA